PTYTVDLAKLLVEMAGTEKYGVYHATNEGICSWAELAAETFRQIGRKTKVIPVASTEYPTKAVRPKNSRMSKQCLEDAGFNRLPNWKDAVGRYLIELTAIQEQ
ncbi:MAG: sugar nucleotide-binding protein, partial [Selenomonadaceae bacterium]|nr:sugar nucleotide-binding protein [Selenomonadaceae bacterium]